MTYQATLGRHDTAGNELSSAQAPHNIIGSPTLPRASLRLHSHQDSATAIVTLAAVAVTGPWCPQAGYPQCGGAARQAPQAVQTAWQEEAKNRGHTGDRTSPCMHSLHLRAICYTILMYVYCTSGSSIHTSWIRTLTYRSRFQCNVKRRKIKKSRKIKKISEGRKSWT